MDSYLALEKRMGLTSITAPAIDDVFGWILLGAVVSMVTHGKADLGALGISLVGVSVLGVGFRALGRYGLSRLRVARAAGGGLFPGMLAAVLVCVFAAAGLRTDMGYLGADPRLWIALLLVFAVSCASTFGATALAARASGLPWKESLSIGLLMNTRALMALVVINIGADMGVLSPATFFWLVAMALFTTVITTPLLVRAYPTPEAAEGWAEPLADSARAR